MELARGGDVAALASVYILTKLSCRDGFVGWGYMKDLVALRDLQLSQCGRAVVLLFSMQHDWF